MSEEDKAAFEKCLANDPDIYYGEDSTRDAWDLASTRKDKQYRPVLKALIEITAEDDENFTHVSPMRGVIDNRILLIESVTGR